MAVRRVLVLCLALLVAATACSGGEAEEPIVFGEGVLPDTVPEDFPVPQASSIGSTLVDNVNGRTEVSMIVAENVEPVAQFFVVNLVNRGYVVDTSAGNDSEWEIAFRRDNLEGTIEVTNLGVGTSSAILKLSE